MKPLIFKIAVIFIGVLIGFQIVFGSFFPKLVYGIQDTNLIRWHQFYTENSSAELVCLGSSTILRHCNPDVISAITHLKTEDIAIPSARADFFERLYEDYLKRNPRPKVLLVSINPVNLDSVSVVPYPEYFYPFIGRWDEVSKVKAFDLMKYNKAFGYFYFKDIYLDMKQNPDRQMHIHGFLPQLSDTWNGKLELFMGRYPHGFTLNFYQPELEKIFKLMAAEEKAGVRCIGVISPEYQEVWKYENNRAWIFQKINELAAAYHATVLNFDDSAYSPCLKKNLFYNSQHLNRAGADIFSKDLADSILNYYPTTLRN